MTTILTAYTSAIGIGDLESLDAADIISIQETFATYENIDRIHRAGKRVFVWTVNEEDTYSVLIPVIYKRGGNGNEEETTYPFDRRFAGTVADSLRQGQYRL